VFWVLACFRLWVSGWGCSTGCVTPGAPERPKVYGMLPRLLWRLPTVALRRTGMSGSVLLGTADISHIVNLSHRPARGPGALEKRD
jgi:hypothetical protein